MRTEKQLLESFQYIDNKITRITPYLKNIQTVSQFSFGTWNSRQHMILAIEAGTETGFGESIIATNQPEIDVHIYHSQLAEIVGCGVFAAIERVRAQRGRWPEKLTELLEMALLDLAGKCAQTATIKLLALPYRQPVYGVSVILSRQPEEVRQKAQAAKANGRTRFLKLKLFGEEDLDLELIRTARQVCPREECYLIGDVNGGYRELEQEVSLEEIAASLNRLYAAGLDACEDPAYISNQDWVRLQERCTGLCLIPDYPLRPAREAVHTLLPGMGGIYNIHPAVMGSLLDAVLLAEKIQDIGAKVMIGDDSLVGPAATVWQQLAMGLGAVWVEAIEKEKDSDFYYRAVRDLATDSRCFPIAYSEKPGFGIDIKESILKEETDYDSITGFKPKTD